MRVCSARAANRNAIYLCEQAAEKLIRAVLTSEKIHAGVRHQLAYRYTTPTGRIPADPPARDVEATADKIEAALFEVAKRLSVDLDAIDEPAAKSSPIR